MSSLLQLSFALDGIAPEVAEWACIECGAMSVTFVDAYDEPVLEPLPGEFRLWKFTRLQALFSGKDAAPVVRALSTLLGRPPGAIAAERIEDRLWEREWLRDFHCMRFGERLWVCPQHESVPDRSAIVVHMEPGLAFGTGTHPSTALCLEWLGAHPIPDVLIDYGCGSGILAIAGVKLGARRAYCFDIDPQALLATRTNAATNGVAERVVVCDSALAVPQGADLLMANILSGPLCELAPSFAGYVRPGGQLVLAGLLEPEVADVTQACGAWFDMRSFGNREGWAGLTGKRHSAPRRAPHR